MKRVQPIVAHGASGAAKVVDDCGSVRFIWVVRHSEGVLVVARGADLDHSFEWHGAHLVAV